MGVTDGPEFAVDADVEVEPVDEEAYRAVCMVGRAALVLLLLNAFALVDSVIRDMLAAR